MISRVTMPDGKNSLEKKRAIFCAGFILRNLFYLFERGGRERKREGEKIAYCSTKNTRRMKIQWKQRIDEIKIPAIKRCTTMRQPLM